MAASDRPLPDPEPAPEPAAESEIRVLVQIDGETIAAINVENEVRVGPVVEIVPPEG
jgi:hypothetical protein